MLYCTYVSGFIARLMLAPLAVLTTALLLPGAASANDLSGSWRGGGSVSFLSGKAERARCRASYSKAGATSYSMNATCATASGSVSQSAIVKKVGGNSYRGSFHNDQYDASGSISITVSGRSQSVYVGSNKGSASMRLSR